MNVEKITLILQQLNKISGFRISLHTADFEEIAAYPKEKFPFCSLIQEFSENEFKKCVDCDSKACKKALETKDTVIYRCRHGLVEAVSPLYHYGALTGFLMMGQVRIEGEDPSGMLEFLSGMGKRELEAREVCAFTPEVREDMIESYVSVMTICASYLTLSNAVTKPKETVAKMAMRYISANYENHISVKDICDAVGYSKSTVLAAFRKEYSLTVNAYLTNLRLEQAKKMLSGGEFTVYEIATRCGFSDQSYFSKVFSRKYGVTPTDYRRDEKQ